MKNKLHNLFEEYISYCKHTKSLRPETIRGYYAVFEPFMSIMPELSSPDQITPKVINEFFKRLQERTRIIGRDTETSGVKDSTIKTYWSRLNSFFEWLVNNEYLLENPLKHLRVREPVYDDNRELKSDDIKKIISAINLKSKSLLALKRDSAMIYLLLFCGLRKTELRLLENDDIDLENKFLTVRGETSKSRKTRKIPMNSILIMHLNDYIQERDKQNYKTKNFIVSITLDTGLSDHGFKHWVNKIIELSKVKFHLHRFRHSFACNLVRSGSSTVQVQKLMGHTDLRMTERYLRSILPEDLRGSIDRLSI